MNLQVGSSANDCDYISCGEDGVTIAVKVVPRAKADEIVGVKDGALKLRLKAPPVEGKANRALVVFMAGILGVKKSCVRIARGDKSRRKLVVVAGISKKEAKDILNLNN